MKKLIYTFIVLACTLFTAKAEVWTPKTLPIPYLVDSTQYVSNPDGVLNKVTCDSINFLLKHLENKTGVQTLVVVVKRLENGDPYEFALELGNNLGIGQKGVDNGLVIVLSTEDRAYQILTGRGLEGTLPDVTCYNIKNDYMIPYLKESKWDEAMKTTVQAICAEVLQDPELKPVSPNDDDGMGTLVALGLVGGGIGAACYYGRKKCPKCKKRKLKVTSRVKINSTKDYNYYSVSYVCKNCGHTFTAEERVSKSSGGGGAAAGGAIAGSSWGSSSRSSGGSYGGGSFGGGGAGGRF